MKLTVGTRMLLGFGIMVALAMALGLYGLYTMAELRNIQSTIAERDMHILGLLRDTTQVQGTLRSLREKSVSQYLLYKEKLIDQDGRAAQGQWRLHADRLEKLLAELQTTTAEYEKSSLSARRKEGWVKVRQGAQEALAAWRELAGEAQSLYDLLNSKETKDLPTRLAQVDRARQNFDNKLAAGVGLTSEQTEIGNSLAAATYDAAKWSLLLGMAAALLVGGACSVLIQRSISTPLAAFMGFAERVGQGDLTQQAASTNVGELERLGQRLNGMANGLKDLTRQTREVAQSLNAATAEILASTQQQAAGTKEQAATMQEITATMEEISQSGAQIGVRAKQFAAAAEATSSVSGAGSQAVQETTRTMNALREQVEEVAENIVALSEKTQAVGEIIATVNDIAERSNLLALNAAIEAAGAGEQGSRFAVVAGEMKSLADQAKESTIQVRTILGDIQKGINSSVMLTEEAVKRAETGKQQADITEQTIRHMAKTTLDSVQAFEQIIGAGSQQQIGFEQVAQGMKDIRQAATQTAAATSQMERAAANLNHLSQELQKTIGRYRT